MNDTEKVNEYINNLAHPLRSEIAAVRNIIKNANSKLSERIKWRAPSFYYKEDLVTFNHWAKDNVVHLIFHNKAIVRIKSDILKGHYDTRRMVYFYNMEEVEAHKTELETIINTLVKVMDK